MWSEFESDVVEGRYRLGKLVRSEGRCGWFETQYNEQTALISLTESLNDEAMLLERLRAAERVKDKNVAAIFATGTATLRETPLAYAVMELTEENLEDVLRVRALSAEETKEVAEGLVSALEAIHKERLVCGRLEAASVLAAGDTIKLRSDHLQVVPPEADFVSFAAKDVHGLGTIVWQCLTQRLPKRATDANDPSLQLLPSPFVQIVRKALSGKATVEEIAALLRPSVSAAPSIARPVAPPATAKVTPTPKASVTGTIPASPKPAVTQQLPLLVDDEAEEVPKTHRALPKNAAGILAGFAVLLLVVAFAMRAMMHSSAPSATAAAAPTAQPTVSVEPVTPALPRSKPAVAALQPSAKPKTASAALAASGAWRVVAFTYNHQDQAEHKAHTINDRHPDLEAGVFSPKGSGAPYLVTLGSAMDRESAFHLRGKAIQEGLPGDTFARNYSR